MRVSGWGGPDLVLARDRLALAVVAHHQPRQSMPPASSMRACRRDCSFSSRRTLAVWRWNRLVVSAATMATMMSALITAAPR